MQCCVEEFALSAEKEGGEKRERERKMGREGRGREKTAEKLIWFSFC